MTDRDRRAERPTDAAAGRRWMPRDAASLSEARELARAYASGQSIRALVSESGKSYGYVHRRVSAVGQLRTLSEARQNREQGLADGNRE